MLVLRAALRKANQVITVACMAGSHGRCNGCACSCHGGGK